MLTLQSQHRVRVRHVLDTKTYSTHFKHFKVVADFKNKELVFWSHVLFQKVVKIACRAPWSHALC